MLLTPAILQAAVIVDDSFADGSRFVTGPLQADFYGSSTSGAIESNVGSIGLVSGSSGRQIHGLFSTVTLANAGDSVKASVTFTTPATISAGGGDDFKFGLYDNLGRTSAAELGQDTSYSTATPNPLFSGLFGYNVELDVEPADSATDLDIRRSDPSTTGRLLATNTGIPSMGSGPDIGYVFTANTSYSVDLEVYRNASGELEITTSFLGNSHTKIDAAPLSYDFGMVGMGSSSGAFGSSNVPGEADNGIDITNFKVEVIPEPATLGLLALSGAVLFATRRMRLR